MHRWLPALVLLGLSCSDGTGPRALNDLVAAQMRWAHAGPEAYRYTVRLSCFCGDVRSLEVDVANDAVVAVRDPATGEMLLVTDHRARTVEGLFQVVRDAIGRGAHSLEVTYDPTWGFPAVINIDYDEWVADEEMYWTASGFTVATG